MSGDASLNATAPPPTASDAVREMRAAGRAGDPVPAVQVNRWATRLMFLFGQQRAVRLEQWGGSFWYQIDERQWYRALAAGEQVRALYTQPLLHEVRRAGKDRDHIWSADRTHCTVCNDPFDWADPYCNPPTPPVPIAVKPQPFNPSWVLPLLDRLERALKRESKRERDEWDFRIAQLRKSIEEHTKEKSR
ncbi:hypothetical protein I5U05_002105 [Stenotrophomonas maltophilia]|nr:hypothetical protein [Stenotrophomonas maltophilia]MBH1723671.1 hypothetical protein [Stenotrophomonas maltophilia]MBH1800800.1 hypothetical protein [Stenotrophomonas maltophilia]MBH1807192.1 hypothetical protein [Stenotrophomonas maltophilia]